MKFRSCVHFDYAQTSKTNVNGRGEVLARKFLWYVPLERIFDGVSRKMKQLVRLFENWEHLCWESILRIFVWKTILFTNKKKLILKINTRFTTKIYRNIIIFNFFKHVFNILHCFLSQYKKTKEQGIRLKENRMYLNKQEPRCLLLCALFI